jgi:predicted HD phosphohydrolase
MVRNPTRNSIFSKVFWITLLFKQNNHHRYGVFLHTMKVALGAIKDKNYKFIPAALLHDIGKPIVAYQKPEDILVDEYSFTDHEEKSYQMIKNWFFLNDWTKNMVRYHYIIRDMYKSQKDGKVERYQFLKKQWDTFDDDFIKDLEIFLKYDDYGKR